MKKIWLSAAVVVLLLGQSGSASAEPLAGLRDLLEWDFRYVQFLTAGHLGKNKPRYGKYDWRDLESTHFRISTYPDSKGLNLGKFFLAEAEKIYAEFSKEMKMNAFENKIHVIIYNSLRDFEETNTMDILIPVGLGGFTEFVYRKRVVVAFRDSVSGFRRLLRHELAHRYQSELMQLSITKLRGGEVDVPIWFIEGAADYYSHSWDATAEHSIRDGYLHNYLGSMSEPYWLPWRMNYDQGAFVIHYLAKTYKNKGDVVSQIFRAAGKTNFAAAFENVIGKSLAEFEQEFRLYLGQRYHELLTKSDITDSATTPLNIRRLLGSYKKGPALNEAAILAAQGNFFVTRGDDFGRTALFLNWTDGKNVYSKQLVADRYLGSNRLRGFDIEVEPMFGFYDHGASFGLNNAVVYAIDRGGRDEIRIQSFAFDEEKKKFHLGKTESFTVPDLLDIQYPVMVSDSEVALIGRKNNFSAVFLFNLKTKQVKRFAFNRGCRGLTYSAALNALVTSVENKKTKSYDLAVGYLDTGHWYFLTETPENEFYQVFSPDGQKLLFVSDKGMVHNIYLYDFEQKTLEQVTDAKIGVFRPQWFANGGLLFNSLKDGELLVQAAQLPQALVSATKNSESISSSEKSTTPFLDFLPNAKSLTVLAQVISEDGTKAIFVVNRKLSMERLKRRDPQIEFYFVDLAARESSKFVLEEFRQVSDFGQAEFLAGTNILLQKVIKKINVAPDPVNPVAAFRRSEYEIYEWYVFDWQEKKLYTVHDKQGLTAHIFGSSASYQFSLQKSPDKRKLLAYSVTRLKVFDVMAKQSIVFGKFKWILGAEIPAEEKVLVVEFAGREKYRLHALDLQAHSSTSYLAEFRGWGDLMGWYPLSDGETVFLVTQQRKDPFYYNVWRLEVGSRSLHQLHYNLEILNLTSFGSAKVKEDKLVVETRNTFGLKRTLTIDRKGLVKAQDEPAPYRLPASKLAMDVRGPLTQERWKYRPVTPMRESRPSRIPKPVDGGFGGSISFEKTPSGWYWAGAVQYALLAMDDLDDHRFYTDGYFQKSKDSDIFGLAHAIYDDLVTGRSLGLNYKKFSVNQERIDIFGSQNIFLDKYLNWDVTLKEEHIRIVRHRYQDFELVESRREWWKTLLGTTFSLDTRVWDYHGPHSGNAVFTSVEGGLDSKSGAYQNFDLNFDARHYWPWTRRSGLALRFAGGKSFGPEPTHFVWGGNQAFRGIPLFSQSGNNYVLQSTEIRFPIFDFAGAKISGPLDKGLAPFIRSFDIRGGLYRDTGDMWYSKEPPDWITWKGHRGFRTDYSMGMFLNVPIFLGNGGVLILRYNKGWFGKTDWNGWIGYNL